VVVGFAPVHPGEETGEMNLDIPYYHQSYRIMMLGTGLVNAADDVVLSPSSFSLAAYPNPFNSATTIAYSLPVSGAVELTLYDVAGREVRRVLSQAMTAGSHQLTLDAGSLSSGLYFAQLTAPHHQMTAKLLLIR
jgi:hypothetical protein